MTSLPIAVRGLLADVTDAFTVLAEHPRHHTLPSSVWEIEGPHGMRWFAKQHAGPRLHQREVDAYANWTQALGADRAPELVAADADTRTVIVTAVPGQSLDRLRLPAAQEREAYRQAGMLLARLHAADVHRTAAVAEEPDWTASVGKRLEAATRYLPADQLAVLRSLAEVPPPALAPVLSHGDFMPKNWLWDPREQRLRIIDFERTEITPAVPRDLCRLHYRILLQRLDLNAAFQHGYNRPLSEDEVQARTAYAVLDALDALCWGIRHHDLGLVDEAHAMIERLSQEHTRRPTEGRLP
ncbi:aminoglycoside phosphotransferase family protein [Streptomyces sp. NPDC002851]